MILFLICTFLASELNGERAEAFRLPLVSEGEISVDNPPQRGTILFFFASWCHVCVKEMDRVKKVYQNAEKRGIDIIGISLQESRETLQSVVKRKQLPFKIALDREMSVAGLYGVAGIPTYVFIDTKGAIVHRGHQLPEDMTALFKALGGP